MTFVFFFFFVTMRRQTVLALLLGLCIVWFVLVTRRAPSNVLETGVVTNRVEQQRHADVGDGSHGISSSSGASAESLVGKRVITTLVTSRRYAMGACALGASLDLVGSRVPRVVLVNDAFLRDSAMLANLTLAGWTVRTIKEVASPLPIIKSDIFTKLALFDLLEYERVLFLDADTVALRSFDELLLDDSILGDNDVAMVPELMYPVSCRGNGTEKFAFSDVGGHQFCQGHAREPYHGIPDIKYYNSGVMLFKPSRRIFEGLLKLLAKEPTYDDTCIKLGGYCQDQRLINLYFHKRNVRRLSVVYNWFCQKIIGDQTRSDAFDFERMRHNETDTVMLLETSAHSRAFADAVRLVHYRGGKIPFKPWMDDEGSHRCAWYWQDFCAAFVRAMDHFDRRFIVERLLRPIVEPPTQAAQLSALAFAGDVESHTNTIFRSQRVPYDLEATTRALLYDIRRAIARIRRDAAAHHERAPRRARLYAALMQYKAVTYRDRRRAELHWREISMLSHNHTSATRTNWFIKKLANESASRWLPRMSNDSRVFVTAIKSIVSQHKLESWREVDVPPVTQTRPGELVEAARELMKLVLATPMYVVLDCESINSVGAVMFNASKALDGHIRRMIGAFDAFRTLNLMQTTAWRLLRTMHDSELLITRSLRKVDAVLNWNPWLAVYEPEEELAEKKKVFLVVEEE